MGEITLVDAEPIATGNAAAVPAFNTRFDIGGRGACGSRNARPRAHAPWHGLSVTDHVKS
jgi:hypothetical protein